MLAKGAPQARKLQRRGAPLAKLGVLENGAIELSPTGHGSPLSWKQPVTSPDLWPGPRSMPPGARLPRLRKGCAGAALHRAPDGSRPFG
ncbi:hypothetical protein NSE01_38890 [Novosphingobium sediminis]|uniref:Uncharacterized protein n=1 Tax=Novosphingobium sediminis TaxID=707214 RepID=A0A512AR68_9SPHN|nr:hypothetical protein NSE01_38890 [Novosphingobium sediminis]